MKSKKLFAVLLAGALTLGAIPMTLFNASGMEGEDLRPSESYSEPIERVVSSKVYESKEAYEKDKEGLMEGFETGYVSVPQDPNEPIRAVSEDELEDISTDSYATAEDPSATDPGAGTSHIIDITPYPGNAKGYFGYIAFQALRGDKTKKVHYTSLKRLKGSRDTNDIIYCLQMNKGNPPDGDKMEQIRRESDDLLALMRLGFPRGATMGNKVVPQEIHNCFYASGDRKQFWNYYITQVAIWVKVGDTDIHAVKRGTVKNSGPSDIISKVDKFYHAVPKYKNDWVIPKIWVSHKRKEAKVDEKDSSQLCTPAYERDLAAAAQPRDVLKLMEKNVFTDAPTSNGNTRVPPAMTMTFPDGHPKGLRVLVWDKRADKDRVYHIDNGDKPKLYGQDQFRFIIPDPEPEGEFTYKINGPCWTWKAYRYKDGDYQEMLKEEVVEFGSNIGTDGEVFWKLPDKPTPPPPPPQPDEYTIRAKKLMQKQDKHYRVQNLH